MHLLMAAILARGADVITIAEHGSRIVESMRKLLLKYASILQQTDKILSCKKFS